MSHSFFSVSPVGVSSFLRPERCPPSISQWSIRLIMARRAKVAASGTTDSRFCNRKVLAISAYIRNSSAVVRPLDISWRKSCWPWKKVTRT